MTLECANTPLEADWAMQALVELEAELSRPPLALVEPARPLVAYTILFGEVPNIGIQRRVRAAYAAVSRRPHRRAERGYVYAFRDVRDGDSAIVKIGSTIHVRRRISEWRKSLGARDDELALLFSSSTEDVRLAEQLVHNLLYCQWLPKRVRVDTGAPLLEYFAVENLDALRLLIAAVTRHVTWFTQARFIRSRLL